MAKNVNNKGKAVSEAEKRAQELVDEAKQNVIRAITLLTEPVEILEDQIFDLKPEDISNIAKSINLLEVACEDLKIACRNCNWNSEICYQIDDACRKFGVCLAGVLASDENKENVYPEFDGKEGLAILGKVLASLVRWNEEEQN